MQGLQWCNGGGDGMGWDGMGKRVGIGKCGVSLSHTLISPSRIRIFPFSRGFSKTVQKYSNYMPWGPEIATK